MTLFCFSRLHENVGRTVGLRSQVSAGENYCALRPGDGVAGEKVKGSDETSAEICNFGERVCLTAGVFEKDCLANYVNVGRCAGCHTPRDKNGEEIAGLEFGGGGVFEGNVASANITPDSSGLSHYGEAMFIKTMRTGRVGGVRNLSSMMPWVYFRNMTDEDLKAIFAYLLILKPVRHRVDNAEPPTYCKRCRGRHGLGYLN